MIGIDKILDANFKVNQWSDRVAFLLSCPDTDIPCIKNEYFLVDDLPILFVDKWEDYLKLDKVFLENKWVEMMETEWNYDKIKFSYWKELILNSDNF